MKESYTIRGVELKYNWHVHAKDSERKFELPLGQHFMDTFENVVEIGAVMSYQGCVAHTVFDPYDPHPDCIRDDLTVVDFDFTGRNVLSISTLEHIGNAEYGNELPKPTVAIDLLNKIIKGADKYLITWAKGHNKTFDKQVLDLGIKFIPFARMNEDNEWEEIELSKFVDMEYNKPFGYGNAVFVVNNFF